MGRARRGRYLPGRQLTELARMTGYQDIGRT